MTKKNNSKTGQKIIKKTSAAKSKIRGSSKNTPWDSNAAFDKMLNRGGYRI